MKTRSPLHRIDPEAREAASGSPGILASEKAISALGAIGIVSVAWGWVSGEERILSLRTLLEGSEIVIRGTVLDQEKGPGGLWHRIQVEEVIWPLPAGEGRWEPVGPMLRVFAHGIGIPEGADLTAGEDLILGISRIPPPPRDGGHPFLRELWENFRSDRPGEGPALVAPDGIVEARSDPARAQAVVRLVRGLRDPSAPEQARRELLLEMAGDPSPAIREASVLSLGWMEVGLDAESAQSLLTLFGEEVDGAADPAVLSAHLDLLEATPVPGAGAHLARLLWTAPRERIAWRAENLLAAQGTREDFQILAGSFGTAGPAVKVRILRALSLRGSSEHLPVFREALRNLDPAVRAAAVAALASHPAPGAAAILLVACQDPEPAIGAAARSALERRSPGGGRPQSALRAREDDPGRLEALLMAARERMAEKNRPLEGDLDP